MTEFIVFGAKYLVAVVLLGGAVTLAFAGEQRRQFTYVLAIALPLGYALARLAGLFFAHNQPFAVDGFEPLIPHSIDNSFPSDHVLIGGVFASLAFLADRKVGLVLWALTLLVGLSRMLAGLHWGVDIAAAALLALGAVFVARKVVLWVGGRQLYP